MQSVDRFNSTLLSVIVGVGGLTGHLNAPSEPANSVSGWAHTVREVCLLQADQAEGQKSHSDGLGGALDRGGACP